MPGEPLYVAVAVRVDLGSRIFAPDERIVRGCLAVVAQTQDLADVAAEILRQHPVTRIVGGVARIAVADSQIEHLVGPDLRASGRGTGAPCVSDEDVRHILERGAVETAARERDRGVAAIALLHVREIEQMVAFEVRVQHDRVQAARTQRIGGPAGNRLRIELAVAHDAQRSRELCDEQVFAAWQKGQMPRPHESGRNRDHVNPHELARRTAAVRRTVRRAGARRMSVEGPAGALILRAREASRAQHGCCEHDRSKLAHPPPPVIGVA